MFYITSGGRSMKAHVVSRNLEELTHREAWTRAELTLCGQRLVPVNYLTDPKHFSVRADFVCARCAAKNLGVTA